MTTVLDYFQQAFGTELDDDSFADLPVDSPCGEDCKKAIDAGKALYDHACAAFGTEDYGVAQSVMDATIRIIGCYWHG